MSDSKTKAQGKNSGEAYSKKLPEPELVYVIDFFSGCGGMSWGFANTRQSHLAYKILAGIDIDTHALETYVENVAAPGINQNVAEIANNPELLVELVPEFDPDKCRPLLFIGCAPCQGFSAHRKKDERDDPRNNLMISFAKICQYYKPDFVVMENVPEIMVGKYKNYYQKAKKLFDKVGYHLTEKVLDLSHYGVPQRRRRAIVIGGRETSVDIPSPIFDSNTAITVRQAISHLNPIAAGETDTHDPIHRAPNHTERILERIRKTPADGGDRRNLAKEDQLDCHVSVDKGSTPGFTDVYGRLRWDSPSVTITAKSSTPSCGRFLHPEQHRNISIREAGILQGFPQSFEFKGPLVSCFRQIGEAVPPLFARSIAWKILDTIKPLAHERNPFMKPSTQQLQSKQDKLAVVDCFSGAGGLALGFEAAGFDSVYAFDKDEDAINTFRKNISSKAEVRDVNDKSLHTKIGEATAGRNFIIVGGPPCQGFSQQRRGEHIDERNELVINYAELVESLKHRPKAVVLENVTYLDSPRGKGVLEVYKQKLEALGYRVFRHDLNSADFGVPQLRERIVVVGIEENFAKNYSGPKPLTSDRWSTVGETLITNSSILSDVAFMEKLANHEPSVEGALNKRRIAFVDMRKGRQSVPPNLQLECHKKYGGHLDVYGRLDWFSQARTITTGFDSFTRGEYAHPFFHRSITPREGARIQGFPDWFVFEGNRAALRRQIGNAVPPPMAYAIAKGISQAIMTFIKLESKWVV